MSRCSRIGATGISAKVCMTRVSEKNRMTAKLCGIPTPGFRMIPPLPRMCAIRFSSVIRFGVIRFIPGVSLVRVQSEPPTKESEHLQGLTGCRCSLFHNCFSGFGVSFGAEIFQNDSKPSLPALAVQGLAKFFSFQKCSKTSLTDQFANSKRPVFAFQRAFAVTEDSCTAR